jgi:hypothetical protein
VCDPPMVVTNDGPPAPQKPINRRRWLLVGVLLSALAVFVGVTAAGRHFDDPDAGAVDTALTWARLDELPASAVDVEIDARGSRFTRQFTITFRADPDEIDQWLQSSPGIDNANREAAGPIVTYLIEPGDGAQFAQVRYDTTTHVIEILTYWS